VGEDLETALAIRGHREVVLARGDRSGRGAASVTAVMMSRKVAWDSRIVPAGRFSAPHDLPRIERCPGPARAATRPPPARCRASLVHKAPGAERGCAPVLAGCRCGPTRGRDATTRRTPRHRAGSYERSSHTSPRPRRHEASTVGWSPAHGSRGARACSTGAARRGEKQHGRQPGDVQQVADMETRDGEGPLSRGPRATRAVPTSRRQGLHRAHREPRSDRMAATRTGTRRRRDEDALEREH
jgi:hypothetical protein